MIKRLFMLACVILVSGCATAAAIIDIIASARPPVPVCDKESVGAIYRDQVCLKYSDESYRWVKK